MNTQTPEDRRNTVADVTGESRYSIESVRVDIGKLLQDGLLIDIDLHGFGKLKAGVSWQELGINSADKRRDRITKGQKLLTPVKYANALKTLEVRFRQSVVRYSYEVGVFRPWSWIPLTAWDAWKAEWDLLQTQLREFKIELKAALPEIADENREYFRAVARKAWQTYRTPDDDAVIATPDGKVFAGYEAFEDSIVGSALAQLPTADEIDSIFATYRTGYALLPPEISTLYTKANAEDRIKAAEVREAEAAARRAEAAAEKANQDLMYAEASKEARLAAIRQAEYDRAQEELRNTMSPLSEVMLKFRDQVYADVVAISASLQKNGTLVGRVAQKAKGLKDLYELMASCTNDTALEAALDTLNASLSSASGNGSTYNTQAIDEALTGIVSVTKGAADELRRLGSHASRSGMLEL